MFFAGNVPAAAARRIGVHLLREAMTVWAEIDLVSYDRLFPAQDFMPKGSLGNLIAFPLEGSCRKRGTTVFLDPKSLQPFDDQWAFLSTVELLSTETVAALARGFGELATGPDSATYQRPAKPSAGPMPPGKIAAQAGAMLAIDRVGTPPALLVALKHLASLHKPEFYEKEKLRFSTWNTPRFIRCYRETLDQLLLPWALRDKAERAVAEVGSELTVRDGYADDSSMNTELLATLAPEQAAATDVLGRTDLGVLVAPPGSGKTVVGCALIARHRVPTLVIVAANTFSSSGATGSSPTSTSRPSRSGSSAPVATRRRASWMWRWHRASPGATTSRSSLPGTAWSSSTSAITSQR